jgi:tripartite-type tricarboxylate transporter receptor subunit TctC
MRRLVPCLVVTLLVLGACAKKKPAPTEVDSRVAPVAVGTSTDLVLRGTPGDVAG